jgi:hypothetical protein
MHNLAQKILTNRFIWFVKQFVAELHRNKTKLDQKNSSDEQSSLEIETLR